MTANKTRLGSGDFARRIRFEQSGNISATDVQEAIEELDAEKSSTAHAHAASAITNTPAGAIAATDVQAAVNELDTEKQPIDAGLTDIAGLAVTDGNVIVGNGTNWVAESGAAARSSLGLTIGTDVQAFDAQLADIAGLAPTNSNFIVGNGTNFVLESGATARASLGLGALATLATVGTAQIDNDAVDNTKLADMAEDRIKARFSAGTGDPEDATITQVLDNMIGNTRGSIAIRGVSAWSPLVPGTSGDVLTSNGAGADPSYQTAAAGLPVFNGRLVQVSATSLRLDRIDGSRLFINGVNETIPSAGVTVTNGGLSADTTYRVYAFISASVMTLEVVVTARATDTTHGHQIKSGDGTRTLVGIVRTNASSQFDDSAQLRNVASYYNRHKKSGTFTLGSATNITVAPFVELTTSGRVEFVTFGDYDVTVHRGCTVSNSTASIVCYSSMGLDGTSTRVADQFAEDSVANEQFALGSAGVFLAASANEGHHFITGLAGTDSGTANYKSTYNHWTGEFMQ